jgi:hypothetical protein
MKDEPKGSTPVIQRNMDERLRSVGAAIWRMTSAAKHTDGTTIEIGWERNHAIAATAETGGLLRSVLPPARP